MLGFEPATFRTWVSSYNHQTKAPTLSNVKAKSHSLPPFVEDHLALDHPKVGKNLDLTCFTFAHEAAGDVDARAAAGADVRVCRALVNVLALVCHANLAVSLRADAHERSDDVFAVVAAVVGLWLTLIEVHAVPAVRGKCITVRADAAKWPRYVVTPDKN